MATTNVPIGRAGFPVTFDGWHGRLRTDDTLRFNRIVRTKGDIAKVLPEGRDMDDAEELYWIFQLADAGSHQSSFDDSGLTYACVLLPSKKVGREFVKTQGHYHPRMPGTNLEYPEVYSHLFGQIYLLLQRRAGSQSEAIEDLVLIDMSEWGTVTIPPGYAHVLINPSAEPAAIAGIYSTAFKPDYLPFVEMGGAASYLIDDNGEQFIPNRRYTSAPPIRRPPAQSDPHFLAPDGGEPLWSSFLERPERFSFLCNPEAAIRRFDGARSS
jgi:glucose-6-phosphate isomerase